MSPRLNFFALREEFIAELVATRDGRDMAPTVIAMWDYLAKTPGAQLSLKDYRQTIGGNVQRKLARLVERRVITKTACRRGAGGGTGFVCEWLECRRRGQSRSLAELIDESNETEVEPDDEREADKVGDEPYEPARNWSRGVDGLRLELAWIESAAEHGINAVRQVLGRDSEDGLAVEEILRTIQARVTRARSCIANVARSM